MKRATVKVEAYLLEVEEYLYSVPSSSRAEIILKLKQKINEELEAHPERSIDAVLSDFGSPKKVAKVQAHKMGYKAKKKTSWLKRFFLWSFFLFFAFCLSMFAFFHWFTPIVDFNDKDGGISFFGGAIQFDDIDGDIQFGTTVINNDSQISSFSGSKNLADKNIQNINILFYNGSFTLKTSEDSTLSWQCEADSSIQNQFLGAPSPEQVELNFSKSDNTKCEIFIPKGQTTYLNGQQGKVILSQAQFNLTGKVESGHLEVSPADEVDYRYNFSVSNGIIDDFQSSSNEKAYLIKFHIANGKISFN